MLLTITNTTGPATDLGYLLHKHPERCQSFDLSFGQAHVFYPEATDERCTAALLLEIDPIGLVRKGRGAFALEQYVNDRPYVASSFVSTAISRVFRSAMSGQCKDRPELVDRPLVLSAQISALPCRGEEALIGRLFEPLGYGVRIARHALDETFPAWGQAPYFTVNLDAKISLRALLTHLYVLIPVLDDAKHYWVGDDEITKLLERGAGWLESHPEKELIAKRYLRHQRALANEALTRLLNEDGDPDGHAADESSIDDEKRLTLNAQRLKAVVSVLREKGASRVLDLGCGEGRLMKELFKYREFTEIAGMDVSIRALASAQRRLNPDQLSPAQRERLKLFQGSLIYRDKRLSGYDAAAIVEVIEHLNEGRLITFERNIFQHARPRLVVITTPNAEYNEKFPGLAAGSFRHRDHRFEWTRPLFRSWGERVAADFRYTVEFRSIGAEDAKVGSPAQMAIFGVG